jgi:hypothetical protein
MFPSFPVLLLATDVPAFSLDYFIMCKLACDRRLNNGKEYLPEIIIIVLLALLALVLRSHYRLWLRNDLNKIRMKR